MKMINPAKFVDNRRVRYSGITLLILLGIFLIIVGYRTYRVYQEDLPSFTSLHNIEPSLKTRIYSSDGTLLQDFYSENRVITPYKQMPRHLIDMLMAVEDHEFFNHWGVNIRRIIGALTANITNWEIVQGASTITQQLSTISGV